MLGVLLVLVAVLVGARVVAGADKSIRVWGLSRDVAAGTTLDDSDVHTVRVQLYGQSGRYLAGGSSPVGQVVNRDLHDGDLLPRQALGPVRNGVLVALPVPAANMPAGVGAGDRIAVYSGPRAQAAAQGSDTTPVLAGLTVQSVSQAQHGVGGSDETAQVIVEVYAATDAKVLLNAISGGSLYVLKQVGDRADSTGERSVDAPRSAARPHGDWVVGGPTATASTLPSAGTPTPRR